MKNYEKISYDQISDIKSYDLEKLKAGHILIQIAVNDDKKEISELVSHVNDKECKSYFRNLVDSDEQLKTSIIEYFLDPYYAYKDNNKSTSENCADIDIEREGQEICSIQTIDEDFISLGRNACEGQSFLVDGETMHYEFYISTGKGDIANFGGSMELDFITEWMTEHGYYSK